jgi:hypothetical protein
MHTHQPVPSNVKVNRELGEIIKGRQTIIFALTKAVDPNHSLMPFDDATQGQPKDPQGGHSCFLLKCPEPSYHYIVDPRHRRGLAKRRHQHACERTKQGRVTYRDK